MTNAAENYREKSRIETGFFRASITASIITASIGLLIFFGWMFGVQALKSPISGVVSMKTNTSIAFVLCGVSLFLMLGGPGSRVKYRSGRALAFVVTLIGLITMCEYIFNADLGIDQALFREVPGTAGTSHPGRMAPNTAANFILLGISLILLDTRNKFLFSAGRVAAFAAGIISLFAVIGYTYNVKAFTWFHAYTLMAPHTAAAFAILFHGVIFARPGKGIMAHVSADNPGGMMLRYSIPGIIFIMFLLGWTRLYGEKIGLYDAYYGASLFTVIRIAVFLALSLYLSVFINRIHQECLKKEKVLQESEAKYRDIKEVDKLKSQFIAVSSHELRTPLTIIKGFTSLLNKGAAGALNSQQKDFVAAINHNSERLGHIISEMTDISKIESGTMTMEKKDCNIKVMLNSCACDIEQTASKRGISVKCLMDADNPVLNIDRERIEQAVLNLLNNAVKFSRAGSAVTISFKYPYTGKLPEKALTGMGNGAQFALLSVVDSGEGIEPHIIDKVFDRFFQAEEHTTRQFQGMGLGLNIAKNIVEGHGGVIWCESEGKGKGSAFHILLPG